MMTQKEIQMKMDLAWKRIDDCIVAISDAAYEAKNNGKGNTYFVGKVIHAHVTYADYLEGKEVDDELSIPKTDLMVTQLKHQLEKLREIPSWRDDPLLKNLEYVAVLQSNLILSNLDNLRTLRSIEEIKKFCNKEAQ